MISRDKRLKLQLTALAELKSLLTNEIESLAKKSATQSRQLTLVPKTRSASIRLRRKDWR